MQLKLSQSQDPGLIGGMELELLPKPINPKCEYCKTRMFPVEYRFDHIIYECLTCGNSEDCGHVC